MSRRELPPLRRDLFFLIVGSIWGSWTVLTEGPIGFLLISAAVMLGPGFVRLWLLGPGTAGNGPLPPPEPPAPPSLSPLPSPVQPGGEPP